ncbi:MAG TPA: START domain-containing protein [Polyangiaceae bacterium]|nr:START domain-containing protein [Polyangiaceae bacterium]
MNHALRIFRNLRLDKIWLACCLLAAPSARGDSPRVQAWEKFDEDDGIAVYRRDVAGTPVVALRGEGIVDAPLLRVASVLVDTKRATEWIDSLAEARTVRRVSETEYVEWDHIATPFVLKDRDFVFDAKLEFKPAQKQVVLNYHSVNDKDAPKTDYIRGEFIYGTFALTSVDGGKRTRVLAEVLCDPKGSVAKWIVNLFQKSWPHNTVVALREQVKKADIKDDPRLKAELARLGY